MASELQRQFNQIKAKQISNEPIHKGRPSLFLSPKDAAGVDTEEVFDAAFQGLVTLQQYDSRFASFGESLLHSSSVHLQRELKTTEENCSLNSEIKSLLSLLSLFANEKSSHKVIEYLIRRYRIHELNATDLIQYMLPIHDTKV